MNLPRFGVKLAEKMQVAECRVRAGASGAREQRCAKLHERLIEKLKTSVTL